MAYPPDPITPTDVDNDTPLEDVHPDLHDATTAAVNDVVTELGAGPKGAAASVTARLSTLDTTVAAKETPAGAQAKVDAEAAARATADALLLPKAGGTLTGPLVLPGDAAGALQATPLQQVQALIAALVDSAPGTLDTLNELAAALGDDPNFATTITNALAGKQPVDADLTAIAALTTTAFGRALLALADAAAGRTALGLGTAAVEAASAFQPSDADLTAIAALTTTAYGRAFLALADAAAGRTALGLGTAATAATGDFDPAGSAAAAQAASQPLDSDLTAIAALTTTAFGRSLLAMADAAATKTALSLVKADVGLANVDNTSDAGKPVSTAQQAALDAKAADADVVHDTGAETIAGVKTFSSDPLIPDEAYGAGWNGSLEPPTKNAVYDKIETIGGGGGIDPTVLNANSVLYAVTDDTPAALAMGASTILARLASGDIVAATPAQLRTLLSLVVGTDVQAQDADLAAIAALSTTAFGRSLLTGADAAAVRTLISAAPIELGSMFAGIDSRVAFASQFGADEGYDEEFDGYNVADDVLPANWSMLNQDASVYRQSFGAGRIDWGGGGDASNLHAAVRTLPATTTFDAFFHTWGASDLATASATYVAGIVLYNSANGDFIFCGLHQATGGAAPQFFVSHFTDADTQGSTLATGPLQRLASPHIFFRVTKESDTSYDFFGNTDGGCWFTIGSNVNVQANLGADPTHIGFALNTVGAGHVGCEWFRLRDLT